MRFAAIVTMLSILGTGSAVQAQTQAQAAPLTSLHFIYGGQCAGKLDIRVDLRTGTLTLHDAYVPDCGRATELSRNRRQTLRMSDGMLRELTAMADAVWTAGATLPRCAPGGHIQMSLTLVRGSETKKDDYLTPGCATRESRMLMDYLSELTAEK